MTNNIRSIPNTNLYELTIKDRKFYSDDADYFNISMFCLKDILLKYFPVNVHIAIKGSNHKFFGLTIEDEAPDYSILCNSDGTYRVTCSIDLNPSFWDYDITSEMFLTLKRRLILHRNQLNAVIEDQDIINHYLSYSIEVCGVTVEELIERANAFNEDITKEIISMVNNLPRILLNSLGIKEPPESLDSSFDSN